MRRPNATATVKPGAAVLPMHGDGTTYLAKQFRYALGSESIEVACGRGDEGETPADATRRELREELGIEASEWADLGTIDLDTSIVLCQVALFLARGLTHTETEREGRRRWRRSGSPAARRCGWSWRGRSPMLQAAS